MQKRIRISNDAKEYLNKILRDTPARYKLLDRTE